MLEKDPEQRFDINEVDNEIRRIDRQNFTKGYKIVKFFFQIRAFKKLVLGARYLDNDEITGIIGGQYIVKKTTPDLSYEHDDYQNNEIFMNSNKRKLRSSFEGNLRFNSDS